MGHKWTLLHFKGAKVKGFGKWSVKWIMDTLNPETLQAVFVAVVHDSTPWLHITESSGQCFTAASQATELIGKWKHNTGPDAWGMDKSKVGAYEIFNWTVVLTVHCRETNFCKDLCHAAAGWVEGDRNTFLMGLSKGVTLLQSVASWAHACMHPDDYVSLPPTQARTSTVIPLFAPLWHPACLPSRHGRVCVMWEAGACHLVWLSRHERAEAAKRETKLAAASVSGVASPWVGWAILIEGSERSPAPLVHKPLYRIQHHVLTASWDCGGGVIQWQVWERKRRLRSAQVDFFVGKRRLCASHGPVCV